MLIGHIEGANVILAPPEGMSKDDCSALPVRVSATNVGPVMVSAWFPTPGELARLNLGAAIHLHIFGQAHPPVAVTVDDSDAYSAASNDSA